MTTALTSRLHILLAKLAGQDVNLSTMTPPVAASVEEKLLLDIATRLDGMATSTAATTEAAGIVKMSANVAEAAGSAPTAAEFKALLDALIAAGIMAAPANNG